MTLERTDVEFRALDGTTLSTWLYRPTDLQGPAPAVTMAHGFAATKEHGRSRKQLAPLGFTAGAPNLVRLQLEAHGLDLNQLTVELGTPP